MAKKRKTKEQKIISELRRKLSLQASFSGQALRQTPTSATASTGRQDELLQQAQDESLRQTQMKSPGPEKTIKKRPFFNLPSVESKTTSNFPALTPEKSASASAQHNYSYLSKDLKKATTLIGLAILFQVVLYLALR